MFNHHKVKTKYFSKTIKVLGSMICFMMVDCSMSQGPQQEENPSVDQNEVSSKNMVSQAIPTNSQIDANQKQYTIYMVLWNGKTNLESAFVRYLERRNVRVNYIRRDCQGSKDKCHALIPEIRRLKPDLIYTWSTPAAEAIGGTIETADSGRYIWDIPIIALIVTDPIASRLIYNLEKPGRNLTGVNHTAPIESQLNAMLEYTSIQTIAAVFSPNESNSIAQVKSLEEAAAKLNIKVNRFPLPLTQGGAEQTPDENKIEEHVATIANSKPDFIYMPADNFLAVHCQEIVTQANKYKIPTFGATDLMFDNGRPLMGLLSRFKDVGEFGGFKAYQILVEGKQVKEIAYEKLKGFSFLISKSTYEDVGLYPPIRVLKFAEIIEDK